MLQHTDFYVVTHFLQFAMLLLWLRCYAPNVCDVTVQWRN